MKTLFLVGCAKSKQPGPCPAAHLYTSPLFLKSRAYVTAHRKSGDTWRILYAKHGLLAPEEEVGWYDDTLTTMGEAARREWAARVLADLRGIAQPGDEVVILGGSRYYEFLLSGLAALGVSVRIPMRGLRQGERLQWLNAQLNGHHVPPRSLPSEADATVGASRHADTARFYELITALEGQSGGTRRLDACNGRMVWPERGVYFFFEPGELRANGHKRVVRVGTHALSSTSRSTLWGRLAQHRGNAGDRGGNHRGSIFRGLIGEALSIRTPSLACPSWGVGQSGPPDVRALEQGLEEAVSEYIGAMPFLWLDVDGEHGPELRGYIERNSIALLSRYSHPDIHPTDAPSSRWLGRESRREKVRLSGLWNSNHVDEAYDPAFLDVLESLIHRRARPTGRAADAENRVSAEHPPTRRVVLPQTQGLGSGRDRVLDVLRAEDALCDVCAAKRGGWDRQQPVNAICRRLATDGTVAREQEICSGCLKSKIVNVLLENRMIS